VQTINIGDVIEKGDSTFQRPRPGARHHLRAAYHAGRAGLFSSILCSSRSRRC
jgi:hypothetical protein